MGEDLMALFISDHATLREAIACIDSNQRGIALVVDSERRLLGTITDGDARRAMLAGLEFGVPVREILERKEGSEYSRPVTALVGTSPADLLALMRERQIHQVPIVDSGERVVNHVTLDDLVPQGELGLAAVVMAGGAGARLRPLTDALPKPMLPVGGRPLMERILEQLRTAGIKRVSVTTHYMADTIADHFGDGADFGLEIRYVNEGSPLGTAGALALLAPSDEPLLVVNGDILTGVDFRAMYGFHREHEADMTVAVRSYEVSVPYGVVETDGVQVSRITEKPTLRSLIVAGIYLLSPQACREIPQAEPFDMPQLIERLVETGRRVVTFPVREYWIDIGRLDDYERAQREAGGGES